VYTVTLTASNGYGSDSYAATLEIQGGAGQDREARFSSSNPDELGETTVFTNTSAGPDLSYEWDFGDGSPVVVEMNPVHA
jgi:PKD repeat protein